MVIPMDATLAESVEPSLRLVLTGKLTNSHVYGGSDYSGATLDEPAEITTYKYYLLAMVEKVELVDGRSGKVFASTDEGATRTFVPSPAGAR
jgi:hypothetical protein